MVRDMHDSMKILLMSFLLVVLMGTAFSVWAASRFADRTGDQAVCLLLETNIETYNETPPQTPTGKNLQSKYVTLYEQQCS